MAVEESLGPCIEWPLLRTRAGYGSIKVNGKQVYAHRMAWEKAHGPIPVGMCVCHKCDNPPCYNVEHLFLGTKKDNFADCIRKGRRRFSSLFKLNFELAEEIRARNRRGETQRQLAAAYGVGPDQISRIINYKRWPSRER